jgi:hypothetical protein
MIARIAVLAVLALMAGCGDDEPAQDPLVRTLQ